MGEYNGGILQSFNSTTLSEVTSSGGFGELFYYLNDSFHVHFGYGIDDPEDSENAATQIRRNQTYFTNFVWDVNKTVQLGLEIEIIVRLTTRSSSPVHSWTAMPW